MSLKGPRKDTRYSTPRVLKPALSRRTQQSPFRADPLTRANVTAEVEVEAVVTAQEENQNKGMYPSFQVRSRSLPQNSVNDIILHQMGPDWSCVQVFRYGLEIGKHQEWVRAKNALYRRVSTADVVHKKRVVICGR